MTRRRKADAPALWHVGYGGVMRPSSLPERPPAQHGSATSRQAAERVRPRRRGQAQRIIDYLRDAGPRGATADELADALSISPSSAGARCSELAAAGAIRRTDATRRTKYGCAAAVHVLMPDPPESGGGA